MAKAKPSDDKADTTAPVPEVKSEPAKRRWRGALAGQPTIEFELDATATADDARQEYMRRNGITQTDHTIQITDTDAEAREMRREKIEEAKRILIEFGEWPGEQPGAQIKTETVND